MIQITITEITENNKVLTDTRQLSEGQRQAILAVLDIQRIDLSEQGLKQMLKQEETEILTIPKSYRYE